MSVHGSCLCGEVAFALDGPLLAMSHCHCSMCRKMHGTPFATYVAAEAKGFRWLRGTEHVAHYQSSPEGQRSSCRRCGSALPWDSAGEHVFVPAGLLEEDPGVRPLAHIFVASKAPWYDIADELPRFDAYPPGMGEAVERPRATEPSGTGVRGSCLCAGIAYEVDPPLAGPIVFCHCGRCRKARAAAHAANFFVELPHFRWLRGEDLLASYKVPEAERFTQAFCRACGSSMPLVAAARGRAVVPVGSFDDDPGARPELHIFVASKAPWFAIGDGLPQHAEYPPGPYPPPPR